MGKRLTIEPQWLSAATVLAVHAIHIERYGGEHGVRDEGLLYTLLTKPRQRWTYDDNADLASLASVYLTGLARASSFYSANQHTGLACALLFLVLNEVSLDVLREATGR